MTHPDLAPAFTLPRVDGGEEVFAPGSGSPTLVVFTGNRCPYALAWHDRIQAVARDYAPRGVRSLQISPNSTGVVVDDSVERSAERVAGGDFASPYLRDEDQAVALAWGAERTPHAFVIDGAGRIVYAGAPDADHDDPAQNAEYLRTALDELLDGRPLSRGETPAVGCTIKWLEGAAPPAS